MIVDKNLFSSKSEYLAHLVANKKDIINLKKSTVKFSDANSFSISKFGNVIKVITGNEDNIESGIIKRTIVANTYNWLDSHGDVHIKGVFTKTLQENKNNIFHLHDHEYKLTSKVGNPVDIYEGGISWAELGVNKEGGTTSLFMDTNISKAYNAQIFEQYLTKQINQHSVGMMYVKLFMCVNDSQYKEEYTNWNTYFPMVGNSDKALEEGVFFAVTEAKLKEISCVIAGSNELTPTLEPNKIAPVNEPMQVAKVLIDYNYIKSNFKNN